MANYPTNYDLRGDFDFDGYYEAQPDDLAGAPASSSTLSSAPSSSPNDKNNHEGGDDSTQKICTRPRCPHNKVPLLLAKFQETNKRGEVITWKHCKDCRTKHAKEDRERKQAIKAKARARAHDDEDEDSETREEDKNRPTKVVTLRAPSGALKIVAAGGNIAGELAETFADGPILVLRGGNRGSGASRRRSSAFSAFRKKSKKEDVRNGGEWGLQQVQKRRKSVQKGGSSKAKNRSHGGKGKTLEEGELGPEDSVYDSGTNSEEERDKKSGKIGAKRN